MHALWLWPLNLSESNPTQFQKAILKRCVHAIALLKPLGRLLFPTNGSMDVSLKDQRRAGLLSIMVICVAVSVLLCLSLFVNIYPVEQMMHHQAQVSYPVSTHTYSEQEMQETLAFWTPERMRAAVALEASSQHSQLAPQTQQTIRPLGSSHPSGSAASNSSFSPAVSPAQPIPRSLYPTQFRTVGKIFTTLAGGTDVGSGVALISKNRSVVDTAGHVFYDLGKRIWVQKVMFCPQYNNGNCPAGKWVAHVASVDSAWQSNGNFGQDFGDMAVFPMNKGVLDNVIGGSAYQYNGSQFTNELAAGYPENLNGEVMYACSGTGVADPAKNPRLAGIPCNMGGGSSGGPWFSHDAKGHVFVNGHTSAAAEGLLFAPYYNSEWFAVFNAVQNTQNPPSSSLVSRHTFPQTPAQ